jgi:cytochrome c553
MQLFVRARTRRLLGASAATIAALIVGGFLFAWSGIYNIAASRGHWAIIEWLLQFGMSNSVELRARGIEAPPLDNPDLYVLGAAHFHRACVSCHGAPGTPPDLTFQQALPPAPDLDHVAMEWKDRELFWIVMHGIKYTGMPAWVAQERDDEVWAVVAFLKRLPNLDAKSYRELALGAVEPPPQSGRDIASTGPSADAIGACARCHGAEQRGPISHLVPVLHGQPAEFLAAALHAYARGGRRSGIMQPIAAELKADAMAKLAEYYSRLHAPPSTKAAATAESGRQLATQGDANAKIPACAICHDAGALRMFPRLAGQNATYMANRLRLWKKREQASLTDTEAIMVPIARLLSDRQIDEVSAYFAATPPQHKAGPATR